MGRVAELHLHTLRVQKHKLKIILCALEFQIMQKLRCGLIDQSHTIPTFRVMIAFSFKFINLFNHVGNQVQLQTVVTVLLAFITGRVLAAPRP